MQRKPFARGLTLLWASLQLAAPAMSSIADGQWTLHNTAELTTHVEATTTDGCPIVHSPDCAVCRFVSTSGVHDAAAPSFDWQSRAARMRASTVSVDPCCDALGLPPGRAPPTV